MEALEIDDVTNLKLIVAKNASEARSVLEKQIGDNISMASFSQGQPPIFGQTFNQRPSNVGIPRIETLSELIQEPVEDRRCETERV